MVQIVILAAGQGKRMQSCLPKVLHHLAGKPLLTHVLDTVAKLTFEKKPLVVMGHLGHQLSEKLQHYPVQWVTQNEQKGTAHALNQALPQLDDHENVLVLSGDTPLISAKTLQRLIDTTPHNAIGILTANVEHPTGYGRILRDDTQNIIGIVEEKDASDTQKQIREINTSIYYLPVRYIKKWLPLIQNKNHQKEYYLTDLIALAVNEGCAIHAAQPFVTEEILGVNDRSQLANLERIYQRQLAEKLLQQGVTLHDPARFDARGEIQIGNDVVIDINVILEGKVVIGDHCIIGANSILRDTTLKDNVTVAPHTIIDGAIIEKNSRIGPFARIRPQTILAEDVHVGNFVEIKQSHVATQSKINHLSYIGDSTIGKHVNIGAGTITCNYDGANKHQTIIDDDVFVGSSTQLVAPVVIGKHATIGAGSTITHDVAPDKLVIARAPQQEINGWKRPEKKKE